MKNKNENKVAIVVMILHHTIMNIDRNYPRRAEMRNRVSREGNLSTREDGEVEPESTTSHARSLGPENHISKV